MNSSFTPRVIITKAILWFLVGIATAVALMRYVRGLGATTLLTDVNPWGMWIGFDVLSGVALAAGGFVLAATVYIFRLERFHALVRPAVLTAFLGYIAVALGLLVDLGRPWNIWRMIFFWQPHSPLFEVGWCVMLYLTVLALEFAPVVFEGLKWSKAFLIAKKATLPLVITGIALSTLHQSSLGTLFLLSPDRMHPLWYSPILPVLFFLSAVAIGLVMVTTESSLTAWLYRREGEWPLLGKLTRAASVVLGLYVVVRLGDLWYRGAIAHVLDGSWASLLFVVELLLSAVIPLILFTLPSTRGARWAITTGAVMSVAGFILHRADVGGISHISVTGQLYVPAMSELVVSLGLVSLMTLIFLFCIEHLPVWEESPEGRDHFSTAMTDPVSRSYFGGLWFGRYHLQGAAWVIGVVIGVVLLELTFAKGLAPLADPVRAARVTSSQRVLEEGDSRSRLRLIVDQDLGANLPENFTSALLIDGDRQGKTVVFDHIDHQRRLGGENSCGSCHHLNLKLERGTPCWVCHRDMYSCTDTFDHQSHVTALEDNRSCAKCHKDPKAQKTRSGAVACRECHPVAAAASGFLAGECNLDLREAADGCVMCHGRFAQTKFATEPALAMKQGVAPGYRRAMHRLCIRCHCDHEANEGVVQPVLTRCDNCHRGHVESRQRVQNAIVVASEPQEVM